MRKRSKYLSPVSVNSTTGGGQTKRRTTFRGSKHTRHHSPHSTSDQMGVINSKSIINIRPEPVFLAHNIHREPRNRSGENSHDNCCPTRNNTCRRSDSNETSNHALNCADNRRFLEENEIQNRPGQNRHCRANVGVENGCTRIRAGGIWITSVETVPADPEDTSTNQGEENVVWSEIFPIPSETRSDPIGADKSSRSRRYMNDISSRIIDNSALSKETASPETECADRVRKREP